MPITDEARDVADAISSMFRVEVLLARMAPGFAHPIEFGENFFFQRHAFKDCFDHNIRFVKVVVGQRCSNEIYPLVHDLLGKASALH